MTYPNQVLADGALGYWRLNELVGATSAVDTTGHGYTGTPTAVTFGQTGALSDGSKAGLFDGTSSNVDMGNQAAFNFTGAFTAEAWVKLTGTGGYTVVNKSNNASGAGWQLGVGGLSNGFVRTWAYTTAGALVWDFAATTNAVNDGAYHYIAVTWSGTTVAAGVKIYVDGNAVKTATATAAIPGNTINPVRIGAFSAAAFLYFPGTLDEIAVYPTALTPAQIANHYALRTHPAFDPEWASQSNRHLGVLTE